MNPQTKNPDTMTDDAMGELRQDALNMVDKCIECGSCYIDCAFNNYGDDPAQCQEMIRQSNDFILGKQSSISAELKDANLKCAECNRCHTNCPEGIYRRHGNMLMKHKTGNPLRHQINLHPFSNWKIKQPMIEKLSVSRWNEEEKEWYHNRLNKIKKAEVLLYHGCYVYLQAAQCIKLEKMLTAAGVSFVSIGKLEYCCGTFGFYRGTNDMPAIKPRMAEMVEQVQPKRIITNCGHCLNAMSDLTRQLEDNPAPVRHAAEELLELAVANRLDFSHLGEHFSIHDSCNFRSLHDDHSPLRQLLRRFGSIKEMVHHGARSKCCGDVSGYYDNDHIRADNRKVKTREFVATGADRMVTVCAGCFERFHKNPQLNTTDLIDVAYKAFAAARAEEVEESTAPNIEWENMAPVVKEAE